MRYPLRVSSPLLAFQDALLTAKVASKFEAFLKAAMRLDEAKEILGFPSSYNPSDSEVEAVRRKLLLKHHPDRGGDTATMAQINAAADTLKGQLKPDREAPSYEGPAPMHYDPPAVEVVTVTFDEAKSKAGIPAGVEWKFVTDSQRGTSYSSDEFYRSNSYRVAYGKTDTKHVFVGMHHEIYESYVFQKNDKKNVWVMKSLEFPDSSKSSDPAWLYGNVIRALKAVAFEGRFNSKVFDAKDWKFGEKLPQGSPTSIKHWLADSGTVSGDDPRVIGRKHVVELIYHQEYQEKPNTYKVKHKGYDSSQFEGITIVVNGKEYPLGKEDVQRVCGGRALDLIFGGYYYDGSKKNITRAKNGKKFLVEMAESFTTLPSGLKEILAAAAAQMKG